MQRLSNVEVETGTTDAGLLPEMYTVNRKLDEYRNQEPRFGAERIR
jgi:hypothetical protein